MKYLSLLFLTTFLSVKAYAQPIRITNIDKVETISSLFYLPDSLATLKLIDIVKRNALVRFQPIGDTTLNLAIPVYWLKFSVKNETNQDQEWIFDFDNWALVDFYYQDSIQYHLKKTGFLYPFNKRDYPVANKVYIKLPIKAGNVKNCIVRLEYRFRPDNIPQNLQFTIASRPVIDSKNTTTGKVIFFFLGIFSVMFIYNFFIYLSTRLKSYLYYLVILFFAFYMTASNSGYLISLFPWIDQLAAWALAAEFVASNILSIFYLLFVQHFLQTKKRYPTWHKILTIYEILFALFGILLTIHFESGFLLTSLLTLIFIITILYLGIRSVKDKYPSATYFLLGHSSFHAAIICMILVLTGVIPKNDFTSAYSIPTGLTIEIILYSFALGNLINVLRKENEAKQKKIIEQLKENHRIQEEANQDLERLVMQRTAELSQSLKHLKSTQDQLIQREKMASLGELTSGIAHEIQNPLNFVNNFSEISVHLVDELEEERSKVIDQRDIEIENDIIVDIRKNMERIMHHGKRADLIVKGMLEHSRFGSGQKQLTDLNLLVKEQLTIAFHSFNNKGKFSEPELILNLDQSIVKIHIVPQEIARVLINIFNNAFYAVREKSKYENNAYQPQILVTTLHNNETVDIRIKDNGIGISKTILHKIYQPFFTTKPTGEGTGLGLSLSYDIITKGHSGELAVNTEENQFSEFIITLPYV